MRGLARIGGLTRSRRNKGPASGARRSGRLSAVLAATVGLLGVAAACGSGSSISSSPAGVVTTLFSDIQADNCDASYAQLSSRLQGQLGGKQGVCPFVTQLSQRYRNNKFHIDAVVTNGNQASVRSTRTTPNGTSVAATASTVVSNNAWKVDSIE